MELLHSLCVFVEEVTPVKLSPYCAAVLLLAAFAGVTNRASAQSSPTQKAALSAPAATAPKDTFSRPTVTATELPQSSEQPSPAAPSLPAVPLQAAPPPQAAPHSGSSPQNAGNVPVLRTTARIVILDVVVLDKQGNVVTGLTQNDFHVTDNDQPETLINFEAAGAHTPEPGASINSTADLDRVAPRAPVNIILLDEFNTRFEDMAFARYSLKKYLDRQPGKLTQPTMLVAVSLQNFTVLHDYTQDKTTILDALNHHFASYPWQVHQGGWLAERYSTAFGALLRVAAATEGHPGHKNMIWIGRGFPSLNLANVAVDGRVRLENIVQETVNKLRDARVTLYTIDPAGVQINPGVYDTYSEIGGIATDPFGGNYEFNRLARATGGRTFYGRNDVDAEIGTSLRDGASFYTLVYRPEAGVPLDTNKFRKIKVTFENPGYHAVTREGYYPQRGPYRVNPQQPSRRLAFDLGAATSSNLVYDGVPLTLTRDATNLDKFTIHVDNKGLNWTIATEAEPARHCEVILMATSFDKKGKELQHIAKNIRAAAPADVPPSGRLERAMDLIMTLPHDNKAVRARFVVRVTSTGRIGTEDASLTPGPAVTAAK